MARQQNQSDEVSIKLVTRNRKIYHDYHVLEKIEAGIALEGTEVKSLRQGSVSLQEGYARITDGELWILGMYISPYDNRGYADHDPVRKRKLLLHKRQIRKILTAVEHKGMTLVPLSLYFKRGWAKLELALVKGKRLPDKREAGKQQDAKREIDRAMARSRHY
jgi:SsrA-binding protein